MSVGSRIKELRESKNISRNELADSIGVTVGAISNYENEVSSPKEPILFKIMEVLKCDANYLFQDAIEIPNMKNKVSIEEFHFVEKYRFLDNIGRETVLTVLDCEVERVSTINEKDAVIYKLQTELTSQSAKHALSYSSKLTATHAHTDIEASKDDIQHNLDLMNGNN